MSANRLSSSQTHNQGTGSLFPAEKEPSRRPRRGSTRKTVIVALARKLLIALWRLVTTGEVPEGVILRPAA
jgi:hypothetical protein